MLGELIAHEVYCIEQETKCACHDCLSHRAIRKAIIYKKTLGCDCPVCTTTVTTLKNHIDAMMLYLKIAEDQEKEIQGIESKLVIVPQEAEHINGQGLAREKNLAGAIAIASTIENLIIDFREISGAAHQAYDIIEHQTMDDLAEVSAELTTKITTPNQVNHHDIN